MERRITVPTRAVATRAVPMRAAVYSRAAALRAATLVMLAAVLTACGDDDPSDVAPIAAAYELEVSGAVTETASGKAYFGTDEDELGRPIVALLLGDDTSRHLVIAAREGATRPAEGDYAIVDPEESESGWSLLHIISDGDELLGMFTATAGTLTITESTEDVLRGTLEFDAVGLLGVTEDSVAVSGSFVAVPAPAIGAEAAAVRAVRPAGTR